MRLLANAVRFLAIDAVEKANSGHPGMPMGMADIATVLWQKYLRHSPSNPHWANRDRFIVSNGHGSMLLYALLHLTGYDLPLKELKNFRQLHSKTPGHPEYGITPGVETSTGPLGQGFANAVGMALGERILASRFNRENFKIVDHYTYVFVGDGCLMEGISHEAASLAGTWHLEKLIVFWDDNGISIDGETDSWFTDDTAKRFEAYQWQVLRDIDGHDPAAITEAIEIAKKTTDKPTLICCKTIIGFGAPTLAGLAKTHGSPLGAEEISLVRETLDWPFDPFEIPKNLYDRWSAVEQGKAYEKAWEKLFSDYAAAFPDLAEAYQKLLIKKVPDNWERITNDFIQENYLKTTQLATRKASQQILSAYAPYIPALIGGSADLSASNLTFWQDAKAIERNDFSGNYLHYGVREFGMTAIANGLALYGRFLPFVATFLTFSDYARNAIRMAALMHLHNIFIYTHDSIGLGEDGPTHQAIEQLASLRAMPNLDVWRPADFTETAVAWQQCIGQKRTAALLLSRQALPALSRTEAQLPLIQRGGYVLYEPETLPLQMICIATGSELHLAMAVAKNLLQKGIAVRVVSMPCVEVFERQTAEYKATVLPKILKKRVAIEAASAQSWYRYVGDEGAICGIDSFGLSAPAEDLFHYYGFTVNAITAVCLKIVEEQ